MDTLALFDQHRDFHRDQVPAVVNLKQRISEREFKLARRQSLESEVARLNKLLTERELKLAQCEESVTEAELRQNAAEETSRGLTAEFDPRTHEVFALKIHADNVAAKYAATSCSNTVLRAKLSTTAAQRRIAKEARQVTEESQRVADEKSKEVESSAQAAQADLLKAKSKSWEHRKKSKHYMLKNAHYKSKAKRYHSQILAFTKVQDQTWVNGFS